MTVLQAAQLHFRDGKYDTTSHSKQATILDKMMAKMASSGCSESLSLIRGGEGGGRGGFVSSFILC